MNGLYGETRNVYRIHHHNGRGAIFCARNHKTHNARNKYLRPNCDVDTKLRAQNIATEMSQTEALTAPE